MIDLHTHILPGIDDGPRTVMESLQIVAALAGEGCTDLVATPHYGDGCARVGASAVRARVEALSAVVREAGIDIRLWPGHEIQLDANLTDALARDEVASINNRPYLLLELPASQFPTFLGALLGQMRTQGYIPLIAHGERYLPIWHNPDLLVPLVEMGVLVQITAASLLGVFGPQAKHTAETLLGRRLAHVISSDAHRVNFRPPRLPASLAAAERLIGGEAVHRMTVEVPSAILRGEAVPIVPPEERVAVSRRRFAIRKPN